jgi:hypothetical protein
MRRIGFAFLLYLVFSFRPSQAYPPPFTTCPIPILTDYGLILDGGTSAQTKNMYCLVNITDNSLCTGGTGGLYIIADNPAPFNACPAARPDVQFFYTVGQDDKSGNRTIQTRVRCVNSGATADLVAAPIGSFDNLQQDSVVCYEASDPEVGDTDIFDFRVVKCPMGNPLCPFCSRVSTVRQENENPALELQCCKTTNTCPGS